MIRPFVSITIALAMLSTVAAAQRAVTAADYARAEQFLTYNTTPLVLHMIAGGVKTVSDDRFWYVTRTEQGLEAVLVDPAKRTRSACDLAECKEAIARAGRMDGPPRRSARSDAPSPDGKKSAFIRDWNLWLRDAATGSETQLTTDGVKDFGYVTDNAGVLNANSGTIKYILQQLPGTVGALIRTASYGSWFNFYLCSTSLETSNGGVIDVSSVPDDQAHKRCY
jgi:hypothetical protein